MRIVVVGAGNVATHLSLAIQKTPNSIIQVYNRSEEKAYNLANRIQTAWTTQIHHITPDADLYIFVVSDDALSDIIPQIPGNNGLWVHTAGSVPMDIFQGYTKRYGVLYPLQTFSKNREIDMQTVPFFVEACLQDDEHILVTFAGMLSRNVQSLNSEKRKYLHLAAIFACNFSNHMYTLAYKLLEEQNISPDVLLPLIDETVAKIHLLSPQNAQSGPAVRNDLQVISRHLELLGNAAMKDIYQLISKDIYKEVE